MTEKLIPGELCDEQLISDLARVNLISKPKFKLGQKNISGIHEYSGGYLEFDGL